MLPVEWDRARDRAAAAPLRRELAFALARAGHTDEALAVLRELLTTVPPDAELLGLIGRLNKDLALRSPDAEEARGHLQAALAFYLDGYRRDHDAYCGINAASLHALLDESEQARALAEAVVAEGRTEDEFWREAVEAEAALLLGHWPEAKRHYAACAKLGAERGSDAQSVWRQARRLCGFLHGEAGLVDQCFQGCSPDPEPLADRLRLLRQKLENPRAATADADLPTLQLLARKLLQLQEEQRHMLSRELHDNIAQLLSVTTNRIALAGQQATSKELQHELAEVRQTLETVLQEVGTLSRQLRPCLLDQAGLAAALEKHAAAFRERVKLDLTVDCRASAANGLKGERASNIFRIAQEALHNIEKHARATSARIALLERDGQICLEVADNGCSFHPDRAVEARQNGHLGLVGMRERAEMLGGALEVEAKPGQGTVVRVVMPRGGEGEG